jgi:hypothetical protein
MIKIIGWLVLTTLVAVSGTFASEIREFDLKTIERLGAELARVSQTSGKGATTAERKLARETGIAALKGKLFDIHYDYVVLNDPKGSGFLVYALATPQKKGDIVLAGHFRVTVSADGSKAERVDALSKTLAVQQAGQGLPQGSHLAGLYMVQIVSSRPLETLIYTNLVTGFPIVVATFPDGRIWEIENGKAKDTGKSAEDKKK